MQMTRKLFDFLLEHMMDLHKRKLDIVKVYSQDYEAYTSMLEFINSYIRRINDFLDVAEIADGACSMPFVILGSHIYTQSLGLSGSQVYRVVLPKDTQSRPSDDDTTIKSYTCLTPQGKSLLFKQIGDTVNLKENGRNSCLEIIEIRIRTSAMQHGASSSQQL